MDTGELKRIGEELARALDKQGQPFFELKIQLGRLLSHLESEQRVTMNLDRQLTIHDKAISLHERALFGDKEDLEIHPGAVSTLATITATQKRNAKMLSAVLATVISLLVIEGGKLLFTHIK